MPDSVTQFSVNSDEFIWKREEGLLYYNDASAIVIWDASLEILLEAMDEHAGIEKSNEILKEFGFKMGTMVSEYYSERIDLENILIQFSDIYRNAGWGNVKISEFSKEEKNAVIQLHNSWEHRVFKSIKKQQECIILPNFWTGVISQLMKENLTYSLVEKTENGTVYDEIHVFMKS